MIFQETIQLSFPKNMKKNAALHIVKWRSDFYKGKSYYKDADRISDHFVGSKTSSDS